jgi:hypothetical protein
VVLSLSSEAPGANVGPHIQPPSAALSLLSDQVVDRALRGDVEPLAARIEDGSATAGERKFVADWLRKNFRGNPRSRKGKSPDKNAPPQGRAWGDAAREVRNRQIMDLYKERWTIEQIAEKVGLKSRMVRKVLKEYDHGTIKPPAAHNR